MRREEDLLDDARDSLGAANDLLATGRWAKVCFMAHQGAELAVKAALNALGKERRGHDIHRLLEELGRDVPDVLELLDDAKILDQYYIPTRYANAFPEGSAKSHFTERQAREAVSMAQRILSRMEEVIHERNRSGS
jgi:HEPN domain-containing protein